MVDEKENSRENLEKMINMFARNPDIDYIWVDSIGDYYKYIN
jgi:hypothetical protein